MKLGPILSLSFVRTSMVALKLTVGEDCAPEIADARIEEAEAAARAPLTLREARADCAAMMAEDAEACRCS